MPEKKVSELCSSKAHKTKKCKSQNQKDISHVYKKTLGRGGKKNRGPRRRGRGIWGRFRKRIAEYVKNAKKLVSSGKEWVTASLRVEQTFFFQSSIFARRAFPSCGAFYFYR